MQGIGQWHTRTKDKRAAKQEDTQWDPQADPRARSCTADSWNFHQTPENE
jgi:hypothetical protein